MDSIIKVTTVLGTKTHPSIPLQVRLFASRVYFGLVMDMPKAIEQIYFRRELRALCIPQSNTLN